MKYPTFAHSLKMFNNDLMLTNIIRNYANATLARGIMGIVKSRELSLPYQGLIGKAIFSGLRHRLFNKIPDGSTQLSLESLAPCDVQYIEDYTKLADGTDITQYYENEKFYFKPLCDGVDVLDTVSRYLSVFREALSLLDVGYHLSQHTKNDVGFVVVEFVLSGDGLGAGALRSMQKRADAKYKAFSALYQDEKANVHRAIHSMFCFNERSWHPKTSERMAALFALHDYDRGDVYTKDNYSPVEFTIKRGLHKIGEVECFGLVKRVCELCGLGTKETQDGLVVTNPTMVDIMKALHTESEEITKLVKESGSVSVAPMTLDDAKKIIADFDEDIDTLIKNRNTFIETVYTPLYNAFVEANKPPSPRVVATFE